MYFYFDVVYGKNFEKTDSGVICSVAADFGIKKAFLILKQKYGPNCKISLDFGDDDGIYFGDEDEDEDEDWGEMIIPEVEFINKISKYRDWIDNELISNYWIRKWETKRELKI